MNREPKTVADLLACKEFVPYAEETLVINEADVERGYVRYEGKRIKIRGRVGDSIRIPKPTKGYVSPVSEDSIMFARDETGQLWSPVFDGVEWRKERRYFP